MTQRAEHAWSIIGNRGEGGGGCWLAPPRHVLRKDSSHATGYRLQATGWGMAGTPHLWQIGKPRGVRRGCFVGGGSGAIVAAADAQARRRRGAAVLVEERERVAGDCCALHALEGAAADDGPASCTRVARDMFSAGTYVVASTPRGPCRSWPAVCKGSGRCILCTCQNRTRIEVWDQKELRVSLLKPSPQRFVPLLPSAEHRSAEKWCKLSSQSLQRTRTWSPATSTATRTYA